MESKKILKVAEEYFVDYFGREHRPLINQRLGKTSFGLINESNVDSFLKEYINEVNNSYKKNNLGIMSKEKKLRLINGVKEISTPNERSRGKCTLNYSNNILGKKIDVWRGAVVNDATDTVYEKTFLDGFTDIAICHELIHAVTYHISDNICKSGIKEEGDNKLEKMNEWITNNMALEVIRKMHLHGIRFNERIAPSKAIYSSFVNYVKLRKLPANFFGNYKSVLKPAMITGDYRELYDAFGNKEKFTEVCEYLNSL